MRCDHPLVPTDETNLAYKAAALLVERFPSVMTRYGGVEITLEKTNSRGGRAGGRIIKRGGSPDGAGYAVAAWVNPH